MKATDISDPEYFHKVVDCQHACPAHTPVPEYIRLIGQRRYSDAYMVNWESNVFPGILGRTCDRPCERRWDQRTDATDPAGWRGGEVFEIAWLDGSYVLERFVRDGSTGG